MPSRSFKMAKHWDTLLSHCIADLSAPKNSTSLTYTMMTIVFVLLTKRPESDSRQVQPSTAKDLSSALMLKQLVSIHKWCALQQLSKLLTLLHIRDLQTSKVSTVEF